MHKNEPQVACPVSSYFQFSGSKPSSLLHHKLIFDVIITFSITLSKIRLRCRKREDDWPTKLNNEHVDRVTVQGAIN